MEQNNILKRKFGSLTTVCLVVGTVIGSGIWFKSEEMAAAIGGQLHFGVLAWIFGGLIMLAYAYTFSRLASKHEKINGLVDYSEAVVGKGYGYGFGWFMSTVYCPIVIAVLSHAAARFTVVLIGWEVDPRFSAQTFMLAAVYMVGINAMNILTPKLAARFHVTTTFIKLVPLVLMGVVGTIWGLVNGTTAANLSDAFVGTAAHPFFAATFATAFAFAGWETVLSMNSEVKNSRRNLPIALVLGTLIIIGVYILYYVGVYGATVPSDMANHGTIQGFHNVFGRIGGPFLFSFIIVSCLGSCNGISMSNHRDMYSLARRNKGISPRLFIRVDKVTNVPVNSAIMSIFMSSIWLFVLGGSQPGQWWTMPLAGLVIIFYNIALFPILIGVMIKQNDLNVFDRWVMPVVTMMGGTLMLISAILTVGLQVVWFSLIALGIIGIGFLFFFFKNKGQDIDPEVAAAMAATAALTENRE